MLTQQVFCSVQFSFLLFLLRHIVKVQYNYLANKNNQGCGLGKGRNNKACKNSNKVYIKLYYRKQGLIISISICSIKTKIKQKSTKILHKVRLIDGKRDQRSL